MSIFPFINKTILVTGASGFIGSNLCNVLIKENPKKLILIDNLCQSKIDNIKDLLKDERVEFFNIDIRDYENIEPLILQSDFVFHLAAGDVGSSEIYPRLNIETNVLGTFNILQAIKKKPEIRMVHVSSGSVVNPSTIYAISKLAGENLAMFFVKEYGLKISIIRPHHVFGQYQNIDGTSGVINKFLYRILKNEPPIIFGDGSAIKNFTYVQDVVNAILMLGEDDNTIGQVYDVASDTKISIKDLAYLLIKEYAEDKGIKPIYDKPKLGENFALYPNTSKIRMLGWKPKYTFEEGLNLTKEWVEKQLN